jgi:hypothetical protein
MGTQGAFIADSIEAVIEGRKMRKENACDILQKMEAASLKNQMVLI